MSEAYYCPKNKCKINGPYYQHPAWVEQVILVGWSFYQEWIDGFEESIVNMMKTYHIGLPPNAGQLLQPTPDGRCGLVHGLIRTYYLESHSDPNWSPFVSICSLTNPVNYRGIAQTNISLSQMSQILDTAKQIFTHHRPFFYALFHMIDLFSKPQGTYDSDYGVCFKPIKRPFINDIKNDIPILPIKVMAQILRHLDGVSIYQMSKVNHKWRKAAHSRELQTLINFADPELYYLINFTTMGMGGNCGLSY